MFKHKTNGASDSFGWLTASELMLRFEGGIPQYGWSVTRFRAMDLGNQPFVRCGDVREEFF